MRLKITRRVKWWRKKAFWRRNRWILIPQYDVWIRFSKENFGCWNWLWRLNWISCGFLTFYKSKWCNENRSWKQNPHYGEESSVVTDGISKNEYKWINVLLFHRRLLYYAISLVFNLQNHIFVLSAKATENVSTNATSNRKWITINWFRVSSLHLQLFLMYQVENL